jgi:hypothetical protein
LLDGFVLDLADASEAMAVQALGMAPLVVKTVMTSLPDKQKLAKDVLKFASELCQA